MLRTLRFPLVVTFFLSNAAIDFALAADSNALVCLEGLKAAARDEYGFNDTAQSRREFHTAFCEAVKQKLQSNTSVGLSIPVAKMLASLDASHEQLSEFQRNYCRQDSSLEEFFRSTQVVQSLVHGDPLSRFNECMRIADRKNGITAQTQPIDRCSFAVTARYDRTAEKNPATAPVKGTPAVFNGHCSNVPRVLSAQDRTFTCRRSGWAGTTVLFDTEQGPVFVQTDDLERPARPEEPKIPATDTVSTPIPVTKSSLACAANMHDNEWRNCSGPLTAPAGATITNVSYACSGGQNQNGDNYCNWSYHRDPAKGRQADVQWSGNTANWYRRYNTPQDVSETYTITYTIPHTPSADETKRLNQYAADLQAWTTALAADPCATSSKTVRHRASAKAATEQ